MQNDTTQGQNAQETKPNVPTPNGVQASAKKQWTANNVKRFVPVAVEFNFLYPDLDPFEFEFRFALSKEQESKRQDWLSMAAIEQEEKFKDNALDEVCDLLVSLPKGFGDLQSEEVVTPSNAGSIFKRYVTGITDNEARQQINAIVMAANNQYWTKISPRPFRK